MNDDSMIHFRPGEAFGRLLGQFAQTWGISKNETARRLALMSAFGLASHLYTDLASAAEHLGGSRSFEQACQHLRGVLDGALLERKSRNDPPLTDSELRDVVGQAVQMLRDRFKGSSPPPSLGEQPHAYTNSSRALTLAEKEGKEDDGK